jgi:hypothetical protein
MSDCAGAQEVRQGQRSSLRVHARACTRLSATEAAGRDMRGTAHGARDCWGVAKR